jgi:hypothetical protein
LARADLVWLAGTGRGRYVSEHMPASMQALGLTGDLVMTVGAAWRQPSLVGLGLVIVLAGWSHALLDRIARSRRRMGPLPRRGPLRPASRAAQ